MAWLNQKSESRLQNELPVANCKWSTNIFFLPFLFGRHNLFNIGGGGREIAKSVRDSSCFRRPSSTLDVQATGLSAMSVCKRDGCKRGTWGLGPVACFCPPSGPHHSSSFFVWCTACALHRRSPLRPEACTRTCTRCTDRPAQPVSQTSCNNR